MTPLLGHLVLVGVVFLVIVELQGYHCSHLALLNSLGGTTLLSLGRREEEGGVVTGVSLEVGQTLGGEEALLGGTVFLGGEG